MEFLTIVSWLCLLLCSQRVFAQQFSNFSNIDQAGCVAPDAYLTCYEAVVEATATCVKEYSNQPDAQKGCACVDGEEKMNCYAEACWNRVYGCEYQSLVEEYLTLCPIAATDIPFWPTPENAPGGCSCNTAVALETILAMETHLASCISSATGNGQHIYECSCCGISIGISTLFDVCPNTNTTATLNYLLSAGSSTGFSWSECGPYLQSVDCVSGLGYEAPLSTGVVYNPTNTPTVGTQTLFDLPGEPTIPPSGATFSWRTYSDGYAYTVTALSPEALLATTAAGTEAASVTGGAGSENTVTGGAGSENTATGAASSTGLGSGTGSSAGTTKSLANGLLPSIPMLIGPLMILGILWLP